MDKDLAGIDRGKKGLVSNVDKKGIQDSADRHIEKGAVDQPPSGKSHAHIAEATNDVGIGVI
jgi:citrate lyase alpha subunit